ncbi:MAG: VC2046/SO_2500 family protein [Succinivibrio sp.]
MLTHELRNELLVDELQLGQRLNEDIQNQNHADFALVLAMLSQDVTDFPEFYDKTSKVKEEDLRRKFSLPPKSRDYAQSSDFSRADELTDQFATGGIRQVFLSDCLNRAPLVPFERTYSPEVFSELSPLKQEKLRRLMNGKSLSYEKVKETGDGFDILDEINTSRMMSKISASV